MLPGSTGHHSIAHRKPKWPTYKKKNEPTTIAQAKTLQQSRRTGSSDGITDCCLVPYLPHVPGCLKPMHPTIWFAYWFLVSINSTLRDSGVCVPHCCTLFFCFVIQTRQNSSTTNQPTSNVAARCAYHAGATLCRAGRRVHGSTHRRTTAQQRPNS